MRRPRSCALSEAARTVVSDAAFEVEIGELVEELNLHPLLC